MKYIAGGLALLVAVLIFAPAPQDKVRAAPVTVNLSVGWNMVAYLGPSQAVSEALAQINGKYSSVWGFDGAGQAWEAFDPDVPDALNELRILRRYDSYLINMTQAGSLTLDPVAPQPLVNPLLPAGPLTTLRGASRPYPWLPPDGGQAVRLVGELHNLSASNITQVQIVALVQDADGNVTGVLPYGRPLRFIIPAGEVSPFEIQGPSLLEADARFLVVAVGEPTKEDPHSLTLLHVTVQRSPLVEDAACISGEVRNDSENPVSFISVVGSLYNSAGGIAGIVEIFVGYYGPPGFLEPGETQSFDGCVFVGPGDIASYKLWADTQSFGKPVPPTVTADAALSVEDTAAAGGSLNGTYSINLVNGWNLFTYLGPTQPVSQALAAIAGKYTTVTTLDAPSQAFPGHDAEAHPAVNELTTLVQYGAYAIYMKDVGILTFPMAPLPPLSNPHLPAERTSVFAAGLPYYGSGATIVGEVHNLSGANVEYVQIVGFLRDGAGNVVDIAPSGYVVRQIIPTEDSSPFQLFFQLQANHASYDLVATGEATDESPDTGLTLLDLSGPKNNGGAICVTGQVRNDSNQPFGFVRIVGSLYNDDGNVIRIVQGYLGGPRPPFPKAEPPSGPDSPPIPPGLLEPGASAPFEACAYPGVDVSEVTDFKLWAEGEPLVDRPPPPTVTPPPTPIP